MARAPNDVIPGVPFRWLGVPASATLEPGAFSITAGGRTDWFVDPGSAETKLNAPALVASLPGEFTLAARVEVAFRSTFDAGALVLWEDRHRWAKLAFELSPQLRPSVVSVVTRGESDDCNHVAVEGGAVWLRVARLGAAHAFHLSLDGQSWQFVRHFRLAPPGALAEVGFEVQSPLGEGCAAFFSDLRYRPGPLEDLRSGV